MSSVTVLISLDQINRICFSRKKASLISFCIQIEIFLVYFSYKIYNQASSSSVKLQSDATFCIIEVGAFFFNTKIEDASYEMYRANTSSL